MASRTAGTENLKSTGILISTLVSLLSNLLTLVLVYGAEHGCQEHLPLKVSSTQGLLD